MFDDTTPLVEGLSIDEAFLDVRGLRRHRGHARPRSPCACGARCASGSGLPITVGVARTKFLAKVASGVAKPDGLLVVPPDGELAFLHPLPVERLWGVGPVTAGKLHDRGHHDRRRGRRGSPRRRWSRCSGARRAGTCTRSPTTAIPRPVQVGPPAALDRLAARARPVAGRSPEALDAVARRARRPRHPPDARRRAGRPHRRAAPALRRLLARRPGRTRCRGRPRRREHDPRHGPGAAGGGHADDRAPGPHAGRRRGRQPRRRPAPCSSRCRSIAARGGALDAALDERARPVRHRRRSPGPCCSAATRAVGAAAPTARVPVESAAIP